MLKKRGCQLAITTKKTLRNSVVYSVYVRNHTAEGTFQALRSDLGRIRDLGVDIIWLLPIHPIGLESRKGTLGSPYAIRNYREINPELGTMEDFKELVSAIHDYGMKCIIDVVYNHTSPDSWLVTHHPEFFYRTPEGALGNRIGDWGDIVDLDYSQKGLWEVQVDTLKMWAGLVDGFRCDVASLLPLDFWLHAREAVAEVNLQCLWLAESVEPDFILHLRSRGMTGLSDAEILQAFDVCYDYDIYPYFAGYLSGGNTLSQYVDRINSQEYTYSDNYVKLRFLENHDRARAAALLPNEAAWLHWTAFMYFQKGVPLIYGGQERASVICPDLFGKEPVDWQSGEDLSWLFQALYALKQKEIMSLGMCRFTAIDEEGAVIGRYAMGQQQLIGVFSLQGRAAEVEVGLGDGIYQNLIDHREVTVTDGRLYIHNQPIIIEL